MKLNLTMQGQNEAYKLKIKCNSTSIGILKNIKAKNDK
jgi:hypothetical protein